MSAPLYTVEMLRLATGIANYPALPTPDALAERRSTVCGSRVTVGLAFDGGGRIRACGLTVHACALGQASAALLANAIAGRTADEVEAARAGLAAYLTGDAPDAGDWPGLAILEAARAYPARHAAIRLAFEAAAEAAAEAATVARAGADA